MKKISSVIISLVLFFNSIAQQQAILNNKQSNINFCGTIVPDSLWNDAFNKEVEAYKKNLKTSGTLSLTNYIIPVVVHVINSGQSIGTWPNISSAQINSQITILNQDYSGNGPGVTQYNNIVYNGHGPFYDYAQANSLPAPNNTNNGVIVSNTGIQFCMALTDPNGNTLSEPGIDRVNYVTKGFSGPTTITSSNFTSYLDNTLKPNVIWDNTKYLNIYVSDRPSSSGLLGFTTFPASSTLSGLSSGIGTPSNDGIWIYGKSFGTVGTLIAGYDGGQVCGHESGHYFGLRHTWGDGTCLTDYCNDTPPTYQSNYNSNSTIQYPYNNSAGSCSGNFGDGEMYTNLMDYSEDVSKFMFTTDQSIRMQTALQNSPYRKLLGTHGLCNGSATGVVSYSLRENIELYPNPNNGIFNIKTTLPFTTDLYIELSNVLGEIVLTKNEKNISNTIIEFNCHEQGKGVYFISISSSLKEKFIQKIIIE